MPLTWIGAATVAVFFAQSGAPAAAPASAATTSFRVECDLRFVTTTRGQGRPPLVERGALAQVFIVNPARPPSVSSLYALDDRSRERISFPQTHRTVAVADRGTLIFCERSDFTCDRDKERALRGGKLFTHQSTTAVDLQRGTYQRTDSALLVGSDRMRTETIWSGSCRVK